MANRYTNLVGSRKISEDFNNINIGFDRVQAEMDTKGTPADAQAKADAAKAAAIAAASADLAAHKARGADEHPTAKGNAAGFMSAADKLKSDASTNAATPDTLMQRDAAGRAKVTAPVAADDIARKAETDAVQTNLESHAADTDIHVTAEDHDKLDGIAAGAEVNQNAFAKVNDVEASSKSDTLQLTGGPGITVTTDPATKRVTVTATGTATPGAHATSHVTGGSDVIPDAVTGGASGLMSGADAKFVREDGESKSGAQTKADAAETASKAYTDGQIEGIADRLDTPERSAITLQPGIQIVQADQEAAFMLAGLQGRTVLNYQSQIGIYGVLNPYVIRYGENLLPPFYEWTDQSGGVGYSTINGPYDATIISPDTVARFYSCAISVKPGNTYALSAIADSNKIQWDYLDAAGSVVGSRNKLAGTQATLIIPTGAIQIRMFLFNDTVDGTFAFKNIMLNIGNAAKPFKPREDAMLALQTELHANPDTGANPDMVFERDGQYFKLAKWRKVILDSNYCYSLLNSYVGYKRVLITASLPQVSGASYATKYNGTILQNEDTALVADRYNISSNAILVSIANTDSGWGGSYNDLTTDEIKAYFLGWKMCDGVRATNSYNGTGTKYWVYRINGTSGSADADYAGTTSTLPTTQAPNWTPYQLLYQLATPVVEPITSEGQLTLIEDSNQVEVGTGIVLRESANVFSDTFINAVNVGNKLKYKTTNMFAVYKDSKLDKSWSFTRSSYNGEEYMYAKVDPAAYTQSAAYSVTYLMLDKYPAVDITGTYAENEKALLLDTVKTLQDNTTRISVLESKKAEKAEKDAPAWITPTLLNGITMNNYPINRQGYYKNSLNVVQLSFAIIGPNNGGIAQNTLICILPVGYRPSSNVFITGTNTNAQGLNAQALSIVINSEGQVVLTSLLNSPSQLSVTVSGVFLAEK